MTQFTPFTQNFLQSILSSIDSKDPVVANAWLDTLLDVIDLLPLEVLAKEVLAIAINKAGDTQPTFSRLGSCQLIGKLGMKLEQKVIENDLIPVTQNLSQDAEWTIRASMCSQLLSIVKGLTKNGETSEAKSPLRVVLSVLFELGDDEVEAVRLVVIETASAMLQYLDEESIKTLVVPWIKRISDHAFKTEDKALPLLAQQWARISRTVQAHLSSPEKEWFVEFFYNLASLGSTHQTIKDKPNMPDIVADTDNGQKLEVYAEVRHACAVNSAVMAPFIGVETFVSPQRLATLRSMASDPHFVVRRAVAANLLELCRQIGPVVQPFLNHLLTDPCPDVTCALVPQIGAVIETLVRLGPHRSPFTDESIIVETCDAVLRCEEQVMNSSSWRLQEDMLCQLSAFPLCLPCNAVHDRLVPRLWHRIDTLRPLPCRVSAAQTLMLCVRSERRRQERAALCEAIMTRLASGASCHQRMLFLRVCPVLFDLLSRKFIRQHFFLPLVQLANDRVPNVRLRTASLLPRLHMSLRGLDVETEKRLIVELDSTVRRLGETEKDRDVQSELVKFFRWVEEQERIARTETAEHEKRLKEEEAADRRKEEDEKLMLEPTEKCKDEPNSPSTSFFAAAEFPPTVPPPPAPTVQVPSSEERPAAAVVLDPSTDDFYRDAGVRLARPPKSTESSRIPSVSRLRQPTPSNGLKTGLTLPHFGIARGVQQIQPQPSIATGVTISSQVRPAQRRFTTTHGPPLTSLDAAKSRSMENLNVAASSALTRPRSSPRPTRPVSTCLGTNDLLVASSKQSPFTRTRLRASIGTSRPAAALPPTRSSVGPTPKSVGGAVKLSDMKNALPVTPLPSRKLTGADSQPIHHQFGRSKQPPPIRATSAEKAATAASVENQVDIAAARMMQSLELGTRLRRPTSVEASPLQRRNPWRRSLNFGSSTTATSSPPPPPPRKSYATLPRPSSSNNNNNINNVNNNITTPPASATLGASKLPVPAFKRNSYLGSNC